MLLFCKQDMVGNALENLTTEFKHEIICTEISSIFKGLVHYYWKKNVNTLQTAHTVLTSKGAELSVPMQAGPWLWNPHSSVQSFRDRTERFWLVSAITEYHSDLFQKHYTEKRSKDFTPMDGWIGCILEVQVQRGPGGYAGFMLVHVYIFLFLKKGVHDQ